jgi:putative nucleotidyltransferase with HDIG domain
MILLKNILLENKIDSIYQFIKIQIKGTEWENKVYAVGGWPRDKLLGMNPKDLDLMVDKENGGIEFSKWLTNKLGIYKENSNPVIYPKFGTAKFTLQGIKYNGEDLSGLDIEAVMPRGEKYTMGSRKPETFFTDLKTDAERRDLTINALFQRLSDDEIIDLTGMGKIDLKNKIARTPLNPDIIFQDDALRLLRIIRIAVKYGFGIQMSTIKAIKRNAPMLANISVERIQDELNKILMTNNPHKGVRLLVITGLNDYIAPEFKKLVNMAQNEFHQFTADKHTYEVLKNSKPDLVVRLASWFHDIGKGETKSDKDGKIHFYGHEMVSAQLVKKIMERLKYPNDVINAVQIAVKNHMRTKSFGENAEMVSDKALRKLANDLGDHLDNTLEVIDADNRSHGSETEKWKHNIPNQVAGIRDRMKKLGNFTGKLKIPIDGNDVIRLIQAEDPGFKRGPMIAKVLDTVKDKFLENPNISKEEAEKIVIDTYNKVKMEN